MNSRELLNAAQIIYDRWPDDAAIVYVRDGEKCLSVDVDTIWPHQCPDDDDCNECYGRYGRVAYVDPYSGKVCEIDE